MPCPDWVPPPGHWRWKYGIQDPETPWQPLASPSPNSHRQKNGRMPHTDLKARAYAVLHRHVATALARRVGVPGRNRAVHGMEVDEERPAYVRSAHWHFRLAGEELSVVMGCLPTVKTAAWVPVARPTNTNSRHMCSNPGRSRACKGHTDSRAQRPHRPPRV